MTYRPDFSGIRAKIERAIEHHNTLKAEVKPVIRGERHSVRISPQVDANTGEHVFYVTEMPEALLTTCGVPSTISFGSLPSTTLGAKRLGTSENKVPYQRQTSSRNPAQRLRQDQQFA
jgi:hypothetical protein